MLVVTAPDVSAPAGCPATGELAELRGGRKVARHSTALRRKLNACVPRSTRSAYCLKIPAVLGGNEAEPAGESDREPVVGDERTTCRRRSASVPRPRTATSPRRSNCSPTWHLTYGKPCESPRARRTSSRTARWWPPTDCRALTTSSTTRVNITAMAPTSSAPSPSMAS